METWRAVAAAGDGMAQLIGGEALANLVTVQSIGARLAGWRNKIQVEKVPHRTLGYSRMWLCPCVCVRLSV